MFSVNIDVSGVQKVKRKIMKINYQLTINIRKYMKILMGSGALSIQSILQRKIMELVYLRDEPKFYQRTESLFEAVRVKAQGDEIDLYMDDEWLSNRPHVQERSLKTGLAKNATPNSPVPYSVRVEKDFTYQNTVPSVGYHDVERKGSGYMRETFRQIKEDILNGDKDADRIIRPILRGWSK